MNTCDTPLSEQTIEALETCRDDLASEAERAHAFGCATCAAHVVEARALAVETRELLLRSQSAPTEAELDAWVSQAVRPQPKAASRTAPTPSQLWAAAIAIAIASAGALTREVPSLLAGVRLVREASVAALALSQLVLGVVPGGRAGVVLAGVFVLGLCGVLMKRIAADAGGSMLRRMFGASLFTLAAVVLGWLPSTRAHALEFQGDWTAAERPVTLTSGRGAASEVLRRAAQSAGVNLIATLPNDPEVTLAVEGVPLRTVIEAVLADAEVVAKLEGDTLVIRPVGPAPAAAAAAQPVLPPPPQFVADADADDANDERPRKKNKNKARDRVTFGEDIVVREGERVKDVITMGGDADVAGDVLGSIVTMGGQVIVRSTANVRGDLVTFGGEIEIEDGANVEGSRVGWASGGSMSKKHWDRAVEPMATWSGWGPAWLRQLLGSVAHYALLFLLGLLLRGLAPERLSALERTLMRAPGRSLAIGVLGFAGAVVAILVLAITIIGIPAAVVVAIALPIAAYLGLAAVATTLGAALPIERLRQNPIAQLACGVAILFVVSLVPILGKIGLVLAAAFGFGAVLLTRFSKHAVGEQVA